MISIPGSLSFAKLVMMSSAHVKSICGDARYASQDPFIQSTLSLTISTPICIRSAFFLHQIAPMFFFGVVVEMKKPLLQA